MNSHQFCLNKACNSPLIKVLSVSVESDSSDGGISHSYRHIGQRKTLYLFK